MGTLRITQRRSPIGTRKRHRATLQTLGLKKIGQSVDRTDSGPVRGMLRSVAHLISFEEIADAPPAAKAPAKPEVKSEAKAETKTTARAASGTKTRATKPRSSTTRKTAAKATTKKPARKAASGRASRTKKAE